MPKPLASWNPVRDAWETDQGCICGHSDVFSETWRRSGSMRSGVAYELPTWAPPTDASASSSSLGPERLLPTVVCEPDTGNGHARNLGKEVKMLPTPSVADSMGGHLTRSGARSDELLLPGVAKMLGTH